LGKAEGTAPPGQKKKLSNGEIGVSTRLGGVRNSHTRREGNYANGRGK